MKRVLVVTSAFGGHTRGSTIEDPEEIEAVLNGENACHVIPADHEHDIVPVVAEDAVVKRKTDRKA